MFEDVHDNSPQFTAKHAEPVDKAVWPPGDNILVEEIPDILVVVEDHCRVGAQMDSNLGRIKMVNYIRTSKLFAERGLVLQGKIPREKVTLFVCFTKI